MKLKRFAKIEKSFIDAIKKKLKCLFLETLTQNEFLNKVED